jgi:hypothetical protein
VRTRSIIALALVLAAMASAAVASAGADPGASAKPDAGTSLAVGTWKHGLFGTLKAADGCAADRRVVVYEQEGDGRDPSTDRQVDATRTGKDDEAGDWSTLGGTGDPGRYYAAVPATKRCAAATSDSVRPAAGDDNSAAEVPICGEWNRSTEYPEIPDECRIAFRVSVKACGGTHLGDDTKIDCSDPDGLPCSCKTLAMLRFPSADRPRTYVRIQSVTNPFMTLEAESFGEESDPNALFARYVGGGGLYSPLPFRADPGEPGGALLISEDAAGTTIRVDGYVYKR